MEVFQSQQEDVWVEEDDHDDIVANDHIEFLRNVYDVALGHPVFLAVFEWILLMTEHPAIKFILIDSNLQHIHRENYLHNGVAKNEKDMRPLI